jgi:hypothetical protein
MSLALLRVAAEMFAPGFQDNMGRLLGPKELRGLHLNFDAYWYGWMLHGSGRDFFDDGFLGWYPIVPPKDSNVRRKFEHNFRDFVSVGRMSVDHLPEWEFRCRSMGYDPNSLPIVFRVILRDEGMMAAIEELPHSFEGFPIVYESRPPAIGLAAARSVAGTDNVGRTSPPVGGTAGGFLKEANSNVTYLLSCAHVLGNIGDVVTLPGGVAGSSGVNVGKVIRSVLPPPNPPNTSCSSRSPTGVHNLDIALAELCDNVQPDPNVHGIGKPAFVTPVLRMKQGDQVSLVGYKSGKVDAEIDSLTIFHEIDIDNKSRCFGNIYSLTPPRPWYVNTNLVKSGDSGSWILRQAKSMVGWDGVLVAGDGAHAYACFAEDAFDDVQQNVSQNLTLFP